VWFFWTNSFEKPRLVDNRLKDILGAFQGRGGGGEKESGYGNMRLLSPVVGAGLPEVSSSEILSSEACPYFTVQGHLRLWAVRFI
jgi:hypothetical protein